VLSKPVGRAQFLLAKYAGLILALALLTYVNLVAALLASRMAFDAYGSTDLFAVGIFALSLAIAYMMAGSVIFPAPAICFRLRILSDAHGNNRICRDQFLHEGSQAQAFATGVDCG